VELNDEVLWKRWEVQDTPGIKCRLTRDAFVAGRNTWDQLKMAECLDDNVLAVQSLSDDLDHMLKRLGANTSNIGFLVLLI